MGALKSALKNLGVYDRMRASSLYEVYLRLARPDLLRDRQAEIDFYKTVLVGFAPGKKIFDIGGNEGHKAEVFRSMGARVLCVEPDRRNIAHLRGRFARRRAVSIIPKAVSDKVGKVTFNVFDEGSPYNTISTKWVETLGDKERSRFDGEMKRKTSYEVETTTLDELLEANGPAFYVKIDVEGHEQEVVAGLSKKVDYLSFELNLPEFRREGLACVEHLAAIDARVQFNYAVDLKLENQSWLPADHFAAWLAETPLRYMEVYARFR